MKLDLSGTASGGEGESEPLQMQLNGTAASEQGEAVLALIGLPTLPLGLAGELTADLSMQGAPSAGMRTLLKLTAPDGAATADGVISLVGGDIAASGKAQLKSADLQPFIATAGFALPGFGEGLSADLASDFQFAKGILRFPNLTGKLDGEEVSARLEANFADSGLPQLKGEAKLATLEVDSLAAIMLGQDAFEPAKPVAKTIWPRGAFAVRSSLPLLLDVKLNVAQAHMGGFGTATEFSTRLLKSMDGLQLNELTGNWAGGYLVGNVSLSNSDKNALLSTELVERRKPQGFLPAGDRRCAAWRRSESRCQSERKWRERGGARRIAGWNCKFRRGEFYRQWSGWNGIARDDHGS